MRNIKITFKDANPKDPLNVAPTVVVKAEIAGEEFGTSVELDYETSAKEVCEAVQFALEMIETLGEKINHEDQEN